jgi:excinuclease ABC subunit B
MYADKVTRSMQACLDETDRRRTTQLLYNEKHGITPETVRKSFRSILDLLSSEVTPESMAAEALAEYGSQAELNAEIKRLRAEMLRGQRCCRPPRTLILKMLQNSATGFCF